MNEKRYSDTTLNAALARATHYRLREQFRTAFLATNLVIAVKRDAESHTPRDQRSK
jgi:hypothetical protein